MPSHCIVPGCKGNYDNGPRVRVYSFPSNEILKKKWLKAIPRSNFKLTKASKVCELHFKDEDIEMETSAYDPSSGKKISAPLSRSRLTKEAIPSLFPGCPAYLSYQKQNREALHDKKNSTITKSATAFGSKGKH
ncbi:THAP domain-containing protein 2-like [Stegodyphus dumicola]|uniref:THAP domain-containing protein 2-like n=1 Tax=Stegodyphus dumicola TaxID=202533 RepID=UPI0015A9EF38|nr:THAP domain-containing protein 2-like [Stegodyphus dumicola]